MRRPIAWLVAAPSLCALLIGLGTACAQTTQVPLWQQNLPYTLEEFGHRNWVVIADSAYPLQSSEGIKTVLTYARQVDVVKAVLDAFGKVGNVRPNIYLDAELPFVPEKYAPGIDAYRAELRQVLGDRQAISKPHEQIIGMLDEAGKTFNVLILKTTMTLPYTSVFIQLDCGYWSAEAEKALRDAMKGQ